MLRKFSRYRGVAWGTWGNVPRRVCKKFGKNDWETHQIALFHRKHHFFFRGQYSPQTSIQYGVGIHPHAPILHVLPVA